MISGESDRLARTVNDILWASRLDAERLQVSIGSHDAEELTRTVIEAARVHKPDDIELSLSLEPGLPPVAADPDKVRQVLTNLVDNAIKYSPDGGPVEVEVTCREHASASASAITASGSRRPSSGGSSTSSIASTRTSPAASAAPGSASTSAVSSCAG